LTADVADGGELVTDSTYVPKDQKELKLFKE